MKNISNFFKRIFSRKRKLSREETLNRIYSFYDKYRENKRQQDLNKILDQPDKEVDSWLDNHKEMFVEERSMNRGHERRVTIKIPIDKKFYK